MRCKLRNVSPWIFTTESDCDTKILDYLIWLGEMFKSSAATMGRKVSAIRHIHLATGLADFSRAGARYKMLIKEYAAKRPTNRKLPCNVDLMMWVHEHLQPELRNRSTKEIWDGLVLSSFFCMRTSELRNLRHCDIILGENRAMPQLRFSSKKAKPTKPISDVFVRYVEHKRSCAPLLQFYRGYRK